MLGGRMSLGALMVTLALTACTRLNPEYCDAARPCGAGLVCSAETNSCVEGDDCVGDGCLCGSPSDCPSSMAACVDQICRPCNAVEDADDACAQSDADAPICLDGRCVECTDNDDCAAHGDEAPHCDRATYRCGPCAADDECSSGICDEEAGICLGAEALIHVAEAGDDQGPCTAAAPCRTLAGGLARLAEGRTTVVIDGSGAVRQEAISLVAASLAVDRVTIVGKVGTRPILFPPLDTIAAKVEGAGTAVRLERLELRGGSKAGVLCLIDANLTLVDVVVRDFRGVGIDASNQCALTLRRSEVRGNQGGGVNLVDATFALDNNIIAGNGFGQAASRGGLLVIGSTGTVEFCTIADNRIDKTDTAPGIHCAVPELVLRNNIVVGNRLGPDGDEDNAGGMCRHAYSLFGAAIPDLLNAGGNLVAAPGFAADGSYRLLDTSPAIDRADPAATLAVDIDGQPRPARNGRDIGADENMP
jgi:hypothetical protein